jgi:hypothetical protein
MENELPKPTKQASEQASVKEEVAVDSLFCKAPCTKCNSVCKRRLDEHASGKHECWQGHKW